MRTTTTPAEREVIRQLAEEVLGVRGNRPAIPTGAGKLTWRVDKPAECEVVWDALLAKNGWGTPPTAERPAWATR